MKLEDPVLDVMHRLVLAAHDCLDLADCDPDHPEDYGETLTPIAEAGKAAAALVERQMEKHLATIRQCHEAFGFVDRPQLFAREMVYPDRRARQHAEQEA